MTTKKTTLKNKKEFAAAIDDMFDTGKERDNAKACYDFARDKYRETEELCCTFAAEHLDEVFPNGHEGENGSGETDRVCYTMTNGRAIERLDGGRPTDQDWLKSLPKKYVRVKLELNKAKIKAVGLNADQLAELGLTSVPTRTMKLVERGE